MSHCFSIIYTKTVSNSIKTVQFFSWTAIFNMQMQLLIESHLKKHSRNGRPRQNNSSFSCVFENGALALNTPWSTVIFFGRCSLDLVTMASIFGTLQSITLVLLLHKVILCFYIRKIAKNYFLFCEIRFEFIRQIIYFDIKY